MKRTKEQIRSFVLYLLKEYEYEGGWNIEDIQNFTSEKFGVKWIEPDNKKGYGVAFKPDENKVTEYRIYSKNLDLLIETAIWRVRSGDWKKQ